MTDPSDQAARDRLVADLDTTLFVEAGAGTGKTTAVVSRVVALVAAGRLTIDKLVAITFTEAAAAELRVRIRQGLEERCQDAGQSSEVRDRCRLAVEGLDTALIDTIHAFASALLRTWPLEAGLPPDFEVLADIDQDAEFGEGVRRWLDELRPGTPVGDAVGRALLLGLQPAKLRVAARGLEENHDLITADTSWPYGTPAVALETAHALARGINRLLDLLPACRVETDALFAVLNNLRFAAGRLSGAATEAEALVALQLIQKIPRRKSGAAPNWGPHPGIANVCQHIKDGLESIEMTAVECLSGHRVAVLSRVLEGLRDLVLGAVAARRRRGVATFHDLLAWARDLLRDRPDVLQLAQQRWDVIIVDEFQDTDPLQAELAFLLAAEPGSQVPREWHRARLVPGKLMLVGDPKQSIYRFRRADIGVYDQVRSSVAADGGETVHLQENFRSVEHVLKWVNQHFPAVMTAAPGVQPAYIALAPHHADSGAGVWVMGEKQEASMPAVWQAEADSVAEAVRRVVGESWTIAVRGDDVATSRPAKYGDICILIPTRTNLRRLERALERNAVPYQVASGTLMVATQEVRDLLSCLRAIDDPSDEVALVAALRSPAFGISDVELLRWRESGGAFSYEYRDRGDGERLRAALHNLEQLHQLRHEVSPAALVEAFVNERLLVAAAFDGPRPREVWRRYQYVANRARSLAATSRTSLRAFVDWMDGLQRDQVRDAGGTQIDSDEDAVRILTVHGAKGLEFPVVILTGGGSVRQFRSPDVIADRGTGRIEFKLREFVTAGFETLVQRESVLATAEGVRLMYVASTRAQDHLIISLHRGKSAECHAHDFALTMSTFELAQPMPTSPMPPPPVEPPPPPATAGSAEADREAEEAWQRRRTELIASLRALDVRSATSIAHERDKDEVPSREEDVAAFRRGRAGTAMGRAVHALLQVIDLETMDGIDNLAPAYCAVEGIPGREAEVIELVRAARDSEAVQRALASGRYWREVPAGAPVDGVLLEGFIDLLYETDAGGLVVVDYKTDKLTRGQVAERLDRYRLQGGVYALLVGETTGRPVAGVEFVFASLGVTEPLRGVADAMEDVRRLLRPSTSDIKPLIPRQTVLPM